MILLNKINYTGRTSMKKSVPASHKCCATCRYWHGSAQRSRGLLGARVEFDDSEKAKCNKKSTLVTIMRKGTEGGGFIFPCDQWQQR